MKRIITIIMIISIFICIPAYADNDYIVIYIHGDSDYYDTINIMNKYDINYVAFEEYPYNSAYYGIYDKYINKDIKIFVIGYSGGEGYAYEYALYLYNNGYNVEFISLDGFNYTEYYYLNSDMQCSRYYCWNSNDGILCNNGNHYKMYNCDHSSIRELYFSGFEY